MPKLLLGSLLHLTAELHLSTTELRLPAVKFRYSPKRSTSQSIPRPVNRPVSAGWTRRPGPRRIARASGSWPRRTAWPRSPGRARVIIGLRLDAAEVLAQHREIAVSLEGTRPPPWARTRTSFRGRTSYPPPASHPCPAGCSGQEPVSPATWRLFQLPKTPFPKHPSSTNLFRQNRSCGIDNIFAPSAR